ncbi:MAG TPA: type II secretion system minor pseudopilin GspK [Dokdonella sp.]|uniref:type II secretion system minor pseudopilin GspK n=1 Tax=Dokdonella sp. TaxID=2291710 RepID=UPI002D7E9E9F|nr:type II secretion system minor pseudopilin GspK [Dokdonella sp.]HET9031387.1 type II secretion system minor pseudopilin GspK [Dokdonella sp.]
MNFPHRQRGVALLIALLAVALAVILIASLLDRGELAFARTRNALRGEQAIAYSEGMEAYAAQVLQRDREENPNLDTFSDAWAIPLPPQEVPGGRISAQMSDLNGCFNLNNLAPKQPEIWHKRMQNLLVALQLDPSLSGAIIDWIDPDSSINTEGGAEDNAYLAQPIPYRTANRVFAHVSELRLVRGVSGEVYARLAPEVCALPPGTTINLNTASAAVLMSLDSRMTAVLAERIRQNRQARWTSVATALDEVAQQGVNNIDQAGLSVTSSYFLARGEITLDGVPFSFSSVIERSAGGANSPGGIHIFARSRGGEDVPDGVLANALNQPR